MSISQVFGKMSILTFQTFVSVKNTDSAKTCTAPKPSICRRKDKNDFENL